MEYLPEKQIKKSFIFIAAVSFLIIVFSCSDSRYGDIIRFMNMRAEAGEDFAESISRASTKTHVIKALENLQKDAVRLYNELNRINEKYPDGIEISDPPPEYSEAKDRLEKMSSALEKAFEKLRIYSGDQDVQNAITDIFSIPVFD